VSGDGKRYRFGPLVRSGMFGQMPPAQLGLIVGGGLVSFVMLMARILPWAFIPFLVCAVVAFKQMRGRPLHEVLAMRLRWFARRKRRVWFRPIPLLGSDGVAPIELPSQLAGLELLEVDSPLTATVGRRSGVAIIHDQSEGLVTVVVSVAGDGQFSLLSQGDQDHRVGLWGDALAGFCREASPVVRIAWHEWTTTAASAARPSAAVATSPVGGPVEAAASVYRELLTVAAPAAVERDVLIAVTVKVALIRARRSGSVPAVESAIEVLLDELRLFIGRLESAGLRPGAPLSPVEMVRAIRSRSNPGHVTPGGRSLASAVGVSTGDLTPIVVEETFTHCHVDGSVHRSWWVEGWPRLDVPAAWMDMLLLDGEQTRTITVVFEPVPPSRAARAVDEAAVALEAAEASKSKHGFRIRAVDRRRRQEVESREQELVSGYGDFIYAGFIHLTARSVDELDQAGADIEQTAAHCGVQLRSLDGRHGAGWVAGLPVARTLARPAR
jgi:hypothetical protein